MKKFLLIISILCLTHCSDKNNDIEEVPLPELTIQERLDKDETPLRIFKSGISLKEIYGNYYKGGYIFYLDTNTGNGMVTGFQDDSSRITWNSCNSYGLTSEDLWSGKENSALIYPYCVNENIVTNNPSKVCEKIDRDGYKDWFLPSKNELIEMTKNLYGKDGIYFGAVSGYWSSSNIDSSKTWTVSGYKSSPTETLKNPLYNPYDHRVRAIRYFDN